MGKVVKIEGKKYRFPEDEIELWEILRNFDVERELGDGGGADIICYSCGTTRRFVAAETCICFLCNHTCDGMYEIFLIRG